MNFSWFFCLTQNVKQISLSFSLGCGPLPLKQWTPGLSNAFVGGSLQGGPRDPVVNGVRFKPYNKWPKYLGNWCFFCPPLEVELFHPYNSGQIIATSAEVTPNDALGRNLHQNPLYSGSGSIVIFPDNWFFGPSCKNLHLPLFPGAGVW